MDAILISLVYARNEITDEDLGISTFSAGLAYAVVGRRRGAIILGRINVLPESSLTADFSRKLEWTSTRTNCAYPSRMYQPPHIRDLRVRTRRSYSPSRPRPPRLAKLALAAPSRAPQNPATSDRPSAVHDRTSYRPRISDSQASPARLHTLSRRRRGSASRPSIPPRAPTRPERVGEQKPWPP